MWSIVTGWMKVKNRDYSRYDLEREGAMKVRHDRHFLRREVSRCWAAASVDGVSIGEGTI
jgi:hypothetical protein